MDGMGLVLGKIFNHFGDPFPGHRAALPSPPAPIPQQEKHMAGYGTQGDDSWIKYNEKYDKYIQ